jgi:hypothetical protein
VSECRTEVVPFTKPQRRHVWLEALASRRRSVRVIERTVLL